MKNSLMQKIATELEAVADKPKDVVGPNTVTKKDDKAIQANTPPTGLPQKVAKESPVEQVEGSDLAKAIKKALGYRLEQLKDVKDDVVESVGGVVDKVKEVAGDVKDKAKDAMKKQAFTEGYVQPTDMIKQSYMAGYMAKAAEEDKPSIAGDVGIGAAGLVGGAAANAGVGLGQLNAASKVSGKAGKLINKASENTVAAMLKQTSRSGSSSELSRGAKDIQRVADTALAGGAKDFKPLSVMGMELPKIPVGVSKGLRYGALGLPMAAAAYLIANRHSGTN